MPPSSAEDLHLVNDLASTGSSYLQSHKDNPVAWQQWNSASVNLAKSYDRLIFLSVGYSACHWCHVMKRESFSSPEVAQLLNHRFIPIKVDREVHPDIDDFCMNYVSATTGDGGWPLNVFLTPDLEPVFGGTYMPGPGRTSLPRPALEAEELPTFVEVLDKLHEVWSKQRQRCLQSAAEAAQQMKELVADGSRSRPVGQGEPDPVDIDVMDDALSHFESRYDSVTGGFSSAPKFPTPQNLIFLLRIGASITTSSTRFGFPDPVPAILGEKSCEAAASMSLHTLLAMARGGIRDHLGNGFHRYSVTSDWNLPHFEKMLYDNALLLCCYCDAWALSKHPEVLGVIYSLVAYFTSSPILNSGGGFFASEDSDSSSKSGEEAGEGVFYTWTLKEVLAVVGERDGNIIARHFGVLEDGNIPYEHDPHDAFIDQNVLYIAATPSTIAKETGLPESEVVNIIKDAREKLARHRETNRGKPKVDSKIIAGWNGLAITALCRAFNTLRDFDSENSMRCRYAALGAAGYVRQKLANGGSLKRYRSPGLDQTKDQPAYLDDYAYMIQACLALYEMTFEDEWLQWADDMQKYLNRFASTLGAFTLLEETSFSVMNSKPGSDTSMPSPNGVIATNLLLLSSYLKDSAYRRQGRETIEAFAVEISQHPFLYVSMLSALVLESFGIVATVSEGEDPSYQAGFGRVLVRLGSDSSWLRRRRKTVDGS